VDKSLDLDRRRQPKWPTKSRRTYTRQTLYDDDDNYDAEDEARCGTSGGAVPATIVASDENAVVDDPYAEALWALVDETSEAIDQFRSDITSSTFQRLVNNRHEQSTTAAVTTPSRMLTIIDSAREVRERHETILRAMDEATKTRSLLSLDAFAYVPDQHVREFAREASAFVGALMPLMFVEYECNRVHRSERAWSRLMTALGAILVSSHTETLRGHLHDLLHADEPGYTVAARHGEHAHYSALEKSTVLRVLSFRVPSLSLNGIDDGGYYIMLVCHVVDDNDDDCLCFRTCYFARSAFTASVDRVIPAMV
jgi:hypothetical protein